jgi:hypothetical protein
MEAALRLARMSLSDPRGPGKHTCHGLLPDVEAEAAASSCLRGKYATGTAATGRGSEIDLRAPDCGSHLTC